MVRTAYNIEGNAHYDCWTGCFCSPCAVNQMSQTVKRYGRAQIPNVGPSFNINPGKGFCARGCLAFCYDIAYSCICIPCTTGVIMQSAGMPFWFGACCVSPFGANTILRYHNRTRPSCCDESCIDCVIPACFVCVNSYSYGTFSVHLLLTFFF
jgi:hypothetical protein